MHAHVMGILPPHAFGSLSRLPTNTNTADPQHQLPTSTPRPAPVDVAALPYPEHHWPGAKAKLKGFPMKPYALLMSR